MGMEPATELSTVYDPATVEQRVYAFWEQGGYFRATPTGERRPFSMVMPPPNVTGSLHIGHALDLTLADAIVRYRRMLGEDVLWLPGTDHAGIATQTRVEKAIAAETGQSRHDLGRQAFVDRVWSWKQQYGGEITRQVRALGASCDWSRERFTMDEGLSLAVREVFVSLYENGLLYRGRRIINWCPRCGTALSDIEVEHEDTEGLLVHIAYPLVDGTGEVVIATTRPETVFADVAVAVHPQDTRFATLVGRQVTLPFSERQIPIIADDSVDPSYGTGCLKITPAHDPNDFEVGVRHQLEQIQCIDAHGQLTAAAVGFTGMSREDARQQVVQQLSMMGGVRKVEQIQHAVGHCSRCDTVVEPLLSDQWFIRMQPLAERACAAVAAGQLAFAPERFSNVFMRWLENVRDWCVSRQLWWGHRIPAWYCDDCGWITVARTDVTACSECGSTAVTQDEDVLDTWFSSALWPFTTLGWPSDTPDFRRYYPTSVLVTGYDILFFWVARMVFQGLEFTGQLPFHTVVLHGLVRAEDGQKMSKSRGNGVDPLATIERYGADALRYMLLTGSAPGHDQRFREERLENARNFVNKLWNVTRFVRLNLPPSAALVPVQREQMTLAERWILHRLDETVCSVSDRFERFDIGEAGKILYDFAWDDVCDWYVECAKIALYGDDDAQRLHVTAVLVQVLDALLRLLHPFIPFASEEMWQSLPHPHPSVPPALAVAAWPSPDAAHEDRHAVRAMAVMMETVRALRNMRREMNVAPAQQMTVKVIAAEESTVLLFREIAPWICRLANARDVDVCSAGQPPHQAVLAVVTGAEIFVPMAGLVDVQAERGRLGREENRLRAEVERCAKKLENVRFTAQAPAEIVEQERQKLLDYQAKRSTVQERLRLLEK